MSIATRPTRPQGFAAVEGAITTEQDLPITTTLRDTDDAATAVRASERERKNRAGVIPAADQHMGD